MTKVNFCGFLTALLISAISAGCFHPGSGHDDKEPLLGQKVRDAIAVCSTGLSTQSRRSIVASAERRAWSLSIAWQEEVRGVIFANDGVSPEVQNTIDFMTAVNDRFFGYLECIDRNYGLEQLACPAGFSAVDGVSNRCIAESNGCSFAKEYGYRERNICESPSWVQGNGQGFLVPEPWYVQSAIYDVASSVKTGAEQTSARLIVCEAHGLLQEPCGHSGNNTPSPNVNWAVTLQVRR